jgi:hypothetical protein
MVGKAQKSHAVRSEMNSVFGLEKVDEWNTIRTSAIQSRSSPMRFWTFLTMKREIRGKKFRRYEWLQHVFEKWVERCRKCVACQERYFEKETVNAPARSSQSE